VTWLLDFAGRLTEVGTVVAVMAVVGKLVVDAVLKADLERHRTRLRADMQKDLARYTRALDATARSGVRLHREIGAWANPVRDAASSLERRLDNILNHDGYQALARGYVHPDWSITHDYFRNSTVYLFARYFCWIHMLRQELSFELFRSQQERKQFFDAIDAVSRALGDYDPPLYQGAGADKQVFRLQQQAIGELLATRRNGRRACRSYPYFVTRITRPGFSAFFAPVVQLLDSLSPGEKRWHRVVEVHAAVRGLVAACEELLGLPSQQTPTASADSSAEAARLLV